YGELRWSRTRWWEFPLWLVGVRFYRCRNCRDRNFILPGGIRFLVILRLHLPGRASPFATLETDSRGRYGRPSARPLLVSRGAAPDPATSPTHPHPPRAKRAGSV